MVSFSFLNGLANYPCLLKINAPQDRNLPVMINIATTKFENDPFARSWRNLTIRDRMGGLRSRRSEILASSPNNQYVRLGDRASNRNALRGWAQILDGYYVTKGD